jgi:hypothetical protein
MSWDGSRLEVVRRRGENGWGIIGEASPEGIMVSRILTRFIKANIDK